MVKNQPANAVDMGLIPGLGRSPGGGHSNPLQCSCPENSIDRGGWWATVHGVAKSWTRLSMHTCPDPNLGWYFLFDYTGSILLNSFLLGSDIFQNFKVFFTVFKGEAFFLF